MTQRFRPLPMRSLLFALICGLSLGCTDKRGPASGTASKAGEQPTVIANQPAMKPNPATDAKMTSRDNTGVNARDRDGVAKTSFDQSENSKDVSITADIRKQVVATKMSFNAQNVKIITQDGMVTLRGPVTTGEEKRKIEEIAIEVAGVNQVDNRLEVVQE